MKSTYCEYILEKILSTSEVGPILALIAPSPFNIILNFGDDFFFCLVILTWCLVYECIMMSYRSCLHFVPVQWFLAELWPLDFELWPNILLSLLFFTMLWDIDLIFGMWVYNDKLQIKFTFRSSPMIFGRVMALRLLTGQIFGCHHFISLCFEIVTWFLVFGITMMSYRSSLAFVPTE